MDSSNRLAYIRGNLQFYSGDITPEEWVEVMHSIAYECAPVFKYLGTRPLANVLNGTYNFIGGSCYHENKRITFADLINKSPGVSLQARCLELHYDFLSIPNDQCMDRRRWRGLFLIEEKKFLRWEGVYDRGGQITDTAQSCELSLLDKEGLILYFATPWGNRTRSIGYTILERLERIWRELVREREGYLNSIRTIHGHVDGMKNRIIR